MMLKNLESILFVSRIDVRARVSLKTNVCDPVAKC